MRYDCTDPRELSIEAQDAIRSAMAQGSCIVLPTDTVYGIGADAFNPEAVRRLLAAKGRGRAMPPPVLVAAPEVLAALVIDLPPAASDLVAAHWPGPLTIIATQQPSLSVDLGDTGGTIAVRVPDDDLAREVLRITGPLAVSSANLTGRPAATTCEDAAAQLGESVSVYLDGGPTTGQEPSTIVDFSQHPHGRILRAGALSVTQLCVTVPELADGESGA